MRLWRAVCAAAALVVLLCFAFVSASGARRTPPVQARAIHAEFVQERFLTRYTFEVTPTKSVRRVRFEWRLTPPNGDDGCDLLAVQNPTRDGTTWIGHASWLHGDQHGCHHDVQDDEGHPGYVVAVATIETRVLGTWQCAAGIRGTITQTSPYVATCRKKPSG